MNVCFLPGFAQTGSMWDDVRSHLAGIGRALDTPKRLSFEDTAAALAATGGRGAYVGYSQGGRLALQIALDHGVATHLVVVSAGAGLDEAAAAVRRRNDEELAGFAEAHTADEFLGRWLRLPMFAGRDETEAGSHRLDDSHEIAAQLRLLGQGTQPHLWPRLGEIEIPVLVIAGQEDAKYRTIARELARAVGDDASVQVIPGAGHALVETHPEEVAAALRDFLEL